MPVTDLDQLLRQAIIAILSTDATLRTLCGRTTRIAIERDTFTKDQPLPAIAFDLREVDFGSNRLELVLTGCAEGNDSGKKTRELLEAAVAALSYAAFAAQSLEVVPSVPVRRSSTEDEALTAAMNQREGSTGY